MNSKWIKELNMRYETLKFLEENLKVISLTMILKINFLDLPTKTKEIKTKINKINKADNTKLKSFWTAKEAISSYNKRQPLEWEKILGNHISNKRVVPKVY